MRFVFGGLLHPLSTAEDGGGVRKERVSGQRGWAREERGSARGLDVMVKVSFLDDEGRRERRRVLFYNVHILVLSDDDNDERKG